MSSGRRQWLQEFVQAQKFEPNILALVTNHNYHTRKALLNFAKSIGPQICGTVLDVGCGSKPYAKYFSHDHYIGVDIHNPGHPHTHSNIDAFYDGTTLPFRDNAMDAVVTFEVLEHVSDPSKYLAELHRVLKPGGTLVLTMPFMWEEHEQPYDFRRFTSFGLTQILHQQGFEIRTHHKLAQGWPTVAAIANGLVSARWRKANSRPVKVLWWSLARIPVTMFNVLGVVLQWNKLDDALYFNNAVIAEKSKQQ